MFKQISDEWWSTEIIFFNEVIKHFADLYFLKCQNIYGFLQRYKKHNCRMTFAQAEKTFRSLNFQTFTTREMSIFRNNLFFRRKIVICFKVRFISSLLFSQILQNFEKTLRQKNPINSDRHPKYHTGWS